MNRRSALLAAALTWVALAPSTAVHAHKGHASPSPSPSASPSPPPGTFGDVAPLVTAPPLTVTPVPAPSPFRIDVKDALTGHLHNKLVHFPLAFGLAAAVILIGSGKWPQYASAGRALLTVAALAAVGAYFSGEAQHDVFRGTPLWEAVETHELLGKTSGILLIAGAVLSRWKPARRWLWILGVLIFLSLSMTGFLGGVLSHTEF